VRILGVIDLAGGRAVHARGGDREAYAPVRDLAGRAIVDGDPIAVADAYRNLFAIDELYVADLDAITVGRPQLGLVAALARRAEIWLDAGISERRAAGRAVDAGVTRVIVGLETLASFDALAAIVDALGEDLTTFSLDLRHGRALCPPRLLATDTPVDIIARNARRAGATTMTILDVARVGSGGGADFDAVRRVKAAVPDAHLFVGGGLRGAADVAQAATSGCDGVLVATALHDGRLTAAEVAAARRLQPSVSR
jgi:phosphoribosylformimino-5-aminoimidazole carboxamide ribotide isomerase